MKVFFVEIWVMISKVDLSRGQLNAKLVIHNGCCNSESMCQRPKKNLVHEQKKLNIKQMI